MEEVESLHDGEKVELDVRRYRGAIPFILAIWSIPAVLLLGGLFWTSANVAMLGPSASYMAMALVALLALDGLIAYGFILIYNRSRLIVTNRRVIVVTQHGLSGHRVAQCNLNFMQDVSTDHPHVIADLLDYGDISFETSGREERFVFPTCSHPRRVVAKIVKLCREVGEVTTRMDETSPAKEAITGVSTLTNEDEMTEAAFEIPHPKQQPEPSREEEEEADTPYHLPSHVNQPVFFEQMPSGPEFKANKVQEEESLDPRARH